MAVLGGDSVVCTDDSGVAGRVNRGRLVVVVVLDWWVDGPHQGQYDQQPSHRHQGQTHMPPVHLLSLGPGHFSAIWKWTYVLSPVAPTMWAGRTINWTI